MWDFSTLEFVRHGPSRLQPRTARNRFGSPGFYNPNIELQLRRRKEALPAAIAVSWDYLTVTVHCPFCNQTHNHDISHFKYDRDGSFPIQDDQGWYCYESPLTKIYPRVSLCGQIDLSSTGVEYVIVFPFENDTRVKGLSFEIEQKFNSNKKIQRERFRTVGLSTGPAYTFEKLRGCDSHKSSELRPRPRSASVEASEFDDDAINASRVVAASACLGDLDTLKRTVDDYPDREKLLQLQNRHGRSWLHLATYNGQDKIVEYLLKIGCLVDLRNHNGRTPLMEAALWGFLGIVQALLSAGANKDLVDADGSLAVDLADDSYENYCERHRRRPEDWTDGTPMADRIFIKGLLRIPRKTCCLKTTLQSPDLVGAYLHKSLASESISLIMPRRETEFSTEQDATAILFRGGPFPPVAAVNGWTGPVNRRLRSMVQGSCEMLNEGYWALENLELARDLGFSFEPHEDDMPEARGSYNACHAEAQLMCFFVRRNYIFRNYEEGQKEIVDNFLQLFMLQKRNQEALIIVSTPPCSSCIALRDCILERLGIYFDFKQMELRQADSLDEKWLVV